MQQVSDMWLWRFVTQRFSARRAPPVMAQAPSVAASLDLHGYTVQDAYRVVLDYLRQAPRFHKTVTVITGKSGVIAREFPFWTEKLGCISRIEPLNGGGAYRVVFRRPSAPGK